MRAHRFIAAALAVSVLPAIPSTQVASARPQVTAQQHLPQGLTGVNPTRILDTRAGIGAPAAPVGPGGSLDVQVTGQGGVPTDGVAAVVLNVTVAAPTAPGYVTAWPTGEPRPNASNLNFTAGQTIPNLVIVKVGAGGKVSLFNADGQTHLIADVSGYYDTTSQLIPTNPTRLLDTRDGGPGKSGSTDVQVTGVAGVPPSGASAVVANVTVVDPTSSGFLTVWPAGEGRPNASNLNFASHETRPNLVIAKLGAGGKISFYISNGRAHVLIDVLGYINTPPYLTELLDPAASENGAQELPQTNVNGTTYFHSLRGAYNSTVPRWTEYNLGRQWATLATTFTFDDDKSPADAKIRFRVLGDGAVLADQTLTFGQSAPVTVNVTGVLRIRFETTAFGGIRTDYPVFVDPQLTR
jgi:hypothetical protein